MNRFISFEGIDGSGKSTQIDLLFTWLSKRGMDVLVVREPGGTSISERIRDILLDNKSFELSPISESFLFLSARSQLVSESIAPALESGKFVLCDRFIDSTLAYQGYGRGLDLAKLNAMNDLAIDGQIPTHTFLLDVSVKMSIFRRSLDDDDRMESLGSEFLEKVRSGYLDLRNNSIDRITLLDSSKDKNLIFNEIKEIMCNTYGELNA